MPRTRLGPRPWTATLLLAALAAGCPDRPAETPPAEAAEPLVSTEPGAPAEPAGPAEARVSRALTAGDLQPVIRETGAAGVAPETIVVEFARPVVDEDQVGEPPKKGTVLKLTPPVRGTLTFTTQSTLTFKPRKTFAPGTRYKVTLESVETRTGVLTAPLPNPWLRSFTTPDFGFVRFSLADVNTKRNHVDVDLVFSAPVDRNQVRRHAKFILHTLGNEMVELAKPRYLSSPGPHIVRVRLANRQLRPGSHIELELKAGVLLPGNSQATAAAATATLNLEEGEPIDIRAVYRAEGGSGFYVEVICDDGAVEDKRYYWDRVGHESYYNLSRRCVLRDDDAAEGIHFHPAVKFSVSPSGGGFRIFGDFQRGSYTVRFDAGLRSVDGAVLQSEHESSFSVPARTPAVSFVAQGRYLPRRAWTSLAIRHLNLDEVTLAVRHVPPENLVFWMSDPQSEAATPRTSTLIHEETIPLTSPPDELTTTYLDVSSRIPAATRGLLELRLRSGSRTDKARLLLTDLHLVAKQPHAPPDQPWGETVHAWALDVDRLTGVSGVELKLVRESGQVLSTCRTAADGGCALELLRTSVDRSPPFAILASRGNDLTYLKFGDLKDAVQSARVAGEPYRSARKYRAAIYSDRGVYRPGETAHLVGILRDARSLAPDEGMPVQFTLLDPRGKTIKQTTLTTNGAGMVLRDVSFPAFAATGRYEVQLKVAKRSVGQHAFQVEEFVPERMRVTARTSAPEYLQGDKIEVTVGGRYLFGGVPADHRVELTCELTPAAFAPEDNANFHYGIWRGVGGRPAQSIALGAVEAVLDEAGETSVACPGPEQAGGLDGPARVVARAAVFEAGSGRTTVGRATAPVHPEKYYVGLSANTEKAERGTALTVSGVVVDWAGTLHPAVTEVALDFVRLESEYGWYYDEDQGEETHRRYQRPVLEERRTVTVVGGKFTATWTPGQDAQGFLVRAKAGAARTDLELGGRGGYGYWWGPDEARADLTPRPDKPTWLALASPAQVRVGEPATVTFRAPYRGRALLTVETDRVVQSTWQAVEPGETSWSFTLDSFAPNVYVTALVVKDPHLDSPEAYLPDRAFGVQSVPVAPVAFTHPLTIAAPDEIRSRSELAVQLDLGKGAGRSTYATVAAVDEGILSLTGFQSPDPLAEIFRRRALGVDTFETVGWTLVVPPGGPSSTTGGGLGEDGGQLGRVQPVKPVALWSGLVEVPASGKVTVTFDVPQFRGALRVMAVTAGPQRMGRAEARVLVRDPLVVQTTLPRFLVSGDTIQIPVFLTNLSGGQREITVNLAAENLPVPGMVEDEAPSPLTIVGPAEKTLTLADGQNGIVAFQAQTKRAVGAARVAVVATAGKLRAAETADVPLLPAGPKSRRVQRLELASGTLDLKDHLKGWVPLSERSTFWVTSNPYGEAFDHLKYLVRYPYGCIEQTTSSTRPLLFVRNLLHNVDPSLVAADKIEDMVMHGVDRIASMQTPSGGFAYWPGGTEPTHWGSAYATHLLLDARTQRFPVAPALLEDALTWIGEEITNRFEAGDYGSRSYISRAEPYLHYVLALAGKARKARVQTLLKDLPAKAKHEQREHRYMLQAALHLAGDHRYETQLKSPDVSALSDYRRNSWSYYSDRRMRGFMLSTFADLFGADAAGEPLAGLVAEGLRAHPSRWYTTQELVWGITGLGKFVATGSKDFDPPVLTANGRKVTPQPPPAGQTTNERTWSLARASEYDVLDLEVQKTGDGKLFLVLSSEGVRETPDTKFGGDGLEVAREYLTPEGDEIELRDGDHKLGDLVYVMVTLSNTSRERIANVALVDRLPAGWEIENPRLGRGGGVEFIDPDDLWDADHLDLRDDRVEVFGHLDRGESAIVVYAARAVTAGRFTIPSVEAEAMYDPRIWAREQGQTVEIAGPWDDYLN